MYLQSFHRYLKNDSSAKNGFYEERDLLPDVGLPLIVTKVV